MKVKRRAGLVAKNESARAMMVRVRCERVEVRRGCCRRES